MIASSRSWDSPGWLVQKSNEAGGFTPVKSSDLPRRWWQPPPLVDGPPHAGESRCAGAGASQSKEDFLWSEFMAT